MVTLQTIVKPTFVLVMAAVVWLAATDTFAQKPNPQQRATGLFGGSVSDPNARQTLDITLTSTGGYDTSAEPEAQATVGGQSVGRSTMLVGAADYMVQSRRVQFRATGTSAGYFRPLDNASYGSSTHAAAVGLSARSRRTTFIVNQTAMYSSWPLESLFSRAETVRPGDAPAGGPDTTVNDAKTYSYATALTFTRIVTRRISLSALGNWQYTDTVGGPAGKWNLNMYGTGGQIADRLGRNTTATAGYFYRTGDVNYRILAAGPQTVTEQGVQVGATHRHSLSASRHLTLGVQLGESTVVTPAAVQDVTVQMQQTRHLSGEATIGYEFARSWQAHAAYRRGVDYVAGLGQPVSAANVNARVDGLLTSRIDVLMSAAYSRGASTLNSERSVFDAYAADVRLRYAVTRAFATYVEYLHYFYDSRGSLPLMPGLPASLERKGVRVGLVLRVPAL